MSDVAVLTGREWVNDPSHPYHLYGRRWEEEPGRRFYAFVDGQHIFTDGFEVGDLPATLLSELAAGVGVASISNRPLPPSTGGGMCMFVDGFCGITLDRDALGGNLADTFAHEIGHALDPVPLDGREYRRGLAGTEQARSERAAEDYADRWRTPEEIAAARARLSPELRRAIYG